MNDFKKPPSLRQRVKDAAIYDRRVNDDAYRQLEARVRTVELRMQKTEVEILAKMGAMTAAWQLLAKSVDQLSEKVVTRPEFDTVRFLTYGTAIGLGIWIVFKLLAVKG